MGGKGSGKIGRRSHTLTGVRKAWVLLEERYGDAHIAVLLAIQKMQTVKLPNGPLHDRVEALLLSVRTVRACFKVAGGEQQIFADCITLGKLVEKLAQCTQGEWFHYQTKELHWPEKESFED